MALVCFSFSALGNCINALAEQAKHRGDGSKPHVPYRNSVLTWLLKDSLGGNARTVMVAALSPADINFDETLSTLRYANRAKSIQNTAVVNEDQNQKMVRQLREEVAALRAQLESKQCVPDDEAEQRRKQLEEELQESQRLIAQFQMTWAEKEKQTSAIGADRLQALQTMGVSVDASLQGQPHLVNLNEDASLSGCLAYFLREGETLVGRSGVGEAQQEGETPSIRLQGLGIANDHCRLSNSAGAVTVHASGDSAVHTFVNGKRVNSSVALQHGDRVIFGSANFFKFSDPAAAAKILDQPACTWEEAMNERLQEAMSSSLEDSQAAKAALAQAQQDFADQEARLAAEKAEAEAKLVQQQEEFQQKMAEQAGEETAQLQAMKKQLTEQHEAFQAELLQKEERLNFKRQELHRSEVAERQQTLLEDKLARLIPLVEEANLLAAELRRQTVFEVKVVSDYVDAVQHGDVPAGRTMGEPRSSAKVKVTYLTQERSCLWEHDKLSNRIYLMRELYARVQDDPTCLQAVTTENDPFWDPPESQLIGVAHIYLESLSYLLDIRQKTIIVDYQGNTAGTLEVDLVPCSADGGDNMACIDEPEQLVGTRLDLMVRVKTATGVSKQYGAHGSFVCHKFYLDTEVERTPSAAPELVGGVPSYSYEHSRQVTIEQVTPNFVQYLQEGSMTFEVWSQPFEVEAPPSAGAAGAQEDSKVGGIVRAATDPPPLRTPRTLARRVTEVEQEMRESLARVAELEAALAQERQETERARAALAKTEEELTAARSKSATCVIS
eukprot:COSAG05_NODE_1028_length_6112_cov_11.983868_1_plen_783_part_00